MVSHFASKYLKSGYRALSLLDQPCLTTSQIKQIQSQLVVSGCIAHPYAAGKLLAHFTVSEKGDLWHARTIFCFIPHKSTYVWNTMIRAFAEQNQPCSAVLLSKQMMKDGFLLNNYTLSFLFRACSEIKDCSLGFMYHAQVTKLGWEPYDFVQNGMIHCYANCDCMDMARKLFDGSEIKDVITWTAVINGYVKCGNFGLARELFDKMPEKNAISWSTMINGCVQFGLFKEGLDLFNDMHVAGFRPIHGAIVSTLSACGFLGALEQGRWIHAFVKRNKMEVDEVLGTAIVDMYAKCGSMEMACHVFENLPHKDVFAYTSFISGLASHGESARAIEAFKKMENEGVRPNEVTFICVLNACSARGFVEEGLRIFDSMKGVYGMEPVVQHYGCLVDLLGRAGMVEQARKMVEEMPMEPDSFVLGALLNACRIHGDINLSKEIVWRLTDKDPDKIGFYVLLSNTYAAVKNWDHVQRVRKEMEGRKVRKVPGCSLIEVDGVVHELVAGDRTYGGMEEVQLELRVIEKHCKSLWTQEFELLLE